MKKFMLITLDKYPVQIDKLQNFKQEKKQL